MSNNDDAEDSDKLGPTVKLQAYKDRRLREDRSETRKWLRNIILEGLSKKQIDDFPVSLQGRSVYMEEDIFRMEQEEKSSSHFNVNTKKKNFNNTTTSRVFRKYPSPVVRCCVKTNRVLKRFASRKDTELEIFKDHPDKNKKTISSGLDRSLKGLRTDLYGYNYRYEDTMEDDYEGDEMEEDHTTNDNSKKAVVSRMVRPNQDQRPVLRCSKTLGEVLRRFASKEDALSAMSQEHPEKSKVTIQTCLNAVLRGAAITCYGHVYRYGEEDDDGDKAKSPASATARVSRQRYKTRTDDDKEDNAVEQKKTTTKINDNGNQDDRPVLRCCITSGKVLRRFASRKDATTAIHQEHPTKSRNNVQTCLTSVLKGIGNTCYGHAYRYVTDDQEASTIRSTKHDNGNQDSLAVLRCSVPSGEVLRRFASKKDAILAIIQEYPEKSQNSVRTCLNTVLKGTGNTCFGYAYRYEGDNDDDNEEEEEEEEEDSNSIGSAASLSQQRFEISDDQEASTTRPSSTKNDNSNQDAPSEESDGSGDANEPSTNDRNGTLRRLQGVQQISVDHGVTVFLDKRTAARALAEEMNMEYSEDVIRMLEKGISRVLDGHIDTYMRCKFSPVDLVVGEGARGGRDLLPASSSPIGKDERAALESEAEETPPSAPKRKRTPLVNCGGGKTKHLKSRRDRSKY